jgi:hypothetical protein
MLDHRFFGAAEGKHLVEGVREAMELLLRSKGWRTRGIWSWIGRHSYHPHLDEKARTKNLNIEYQERMRGGTAKPPCFPWQVYQGIFWFNEAGENTPDFPILRPGSLTRSG